MHPAAIHRLRITLCGVVFIIATSVALGYADPVHRAWLLSWSPEWISMKLIVAITFILHSIAFFLYETDDNMRSRCGLNASAALTIIICICGFWVIAFFQKLNHNTVGASLFPSTASITGFLGLAGVEICLIKHLPCRRGMVCAAIPFLIGASAVIGYILEFCEHHNVGKLLSFDWPGVSTPMAAPTGVCFLLLGLAGWIICCHE